jgi:hypothetical protein
MREATEEDIGFGPESRKENQRKAASKKIRRVLKECMMIGLSLGEAETVIRRTFIRFCEDHYAHIEAKKLAAK